MASYVPCKKNDPNGYVTYIPLVSQSNPLIFQDNPTLATGDVKICIDDGAPVNITTLPVVDADNTTSIKVVLSQAETNGDIIRLQFHDAAGSEWCDLKMVIHTVAQTFDELDAIVDKLLQVMTGKWEITNNQLIMYDSDGTTALYTFDLTLDGSASEWNPDKRSPV